MKLLDLRLSPTRILTLKITVSIDFLALTNKTIAKAFYGLKIFKFFNNKSTQLLATNGIISKTVNKTFFYSKIMSSFFTIISKRGAVGHWWLVARMEAD